MKAHEMPGEAIYALWVAPKGKKGAAVAASSQLSLKHPGEACKPRLEMGHLFVTSARLGLSKKELERAPGSGALLQFDYECLH